MRLSIFAVAALGLVGCDKSSAPITPPPAAAPVAVAPTKPTGPTGTITGKVVLTGKAPAMAELQRGSDPVCAKVKMIDEEVVINKNGTVKNVLVRLNGAPPAPAESADPVLLQKDCMYRPHVLGMVAGQSLTVRTADQTLHNIHTYKGKSTLFNLAQIGGGADVKKTMTDSGVLLKFRCDVHPWMVGYAWVQNNPYFAVTDDDGNFTIKGVPVGTYDIEAWHERFGLKPMKVIVAADKPAEIKFEYTGSETRSE